MADDIQELASISALMLDQFTTFNMTGWYPRSGSDEFNTLRLMRRNGRFLLRVVGKGHRIVAEIVLNDVVSYVIKVPTWHEVKLPDLPLIALNLSKSPGFNHFYDLLVSSLKVLNKYDRLADRIGADEKAFLDALQVVRVRMELIPLGERVIGDRPSRPPALPPPRSSRPPSVITMPGPTAEPVSVGLRQQHLRRPTGSSIPPSQQMELQSIPGDDEYYVVVPANGSLSSWVCPRCTLINKSNQYQCSACEKSRTDAWRCIRCSCTNHINLSACVKCKELRCRRCDYQNEPGTNRCAMCDSNLLVAGLAY